MKRAILSVIVLSIFFYASAQEKTFLKPADIYRIPSVSDPQLSPDGKWVAYSVSIVDTAKDKRVSHLWMQSWDGKEVIELTHGDEAASTPRWSPDGKYLAFLSARDSKNGSQLWMIDRRGGEGYKVTDIKGDLSEYAWSPDSKKLVLVIGDPANKGKEEPKTPKPIVIDRYHFKQDIEGYLQHLHDHLYLFDVNARKLDTLTKGDKDENSPVWSPDSKTIAFVSNRTADPDKNQNKDIFTIDARPNATMLQLTTWKGRDANPQWSPDGRYISYLRTTSDANYMMYDHNVLCIMDAVGSNNRVLTQQLDRPVAGQVWKDNKNMLFMVIDDRQRYLAGINVNNGKISTLIKGMYSISDINTNASGNVVVAESDPYTPAEMFAVEGDKLRRLTFHHQAWLNTVKLAHVSGFQSRSVDGTDVSGILFKPDSVAGKKWPLILFIHGGPVGQDEYTFDITRQVLASAGYAVIGVNYRGSNGRGLDYCKAIYADWGNKEVKDLLGAVDYMERMGIADPNRLGIGGWSYGGILTDYTIASDTRFKAAASGAGSALQLSVYGSDQYVLQYENEIGAPWKNADKWIQISYPFFHADKIKTPVMFMSGLRDFNVPTIGSEQMYQALRSQGIPTELILYPNQFHGLTKPSYQVDRLQRYIEWYSKYLK
ncbi:S9 family peptidase [Mucilaginibacter pocheonensis]|uniref:Acyl-peptide hydrolase n=1 Tax=Mucilaginibacter pocheonensis TaxID=398050 RepID=A0ABU1T7W0_9SPHI|nr:S9 family peptidase [Mucilaginibacter pocheonensis]MDR6941321.1 dipeptidyl aminopeptidase/acylaminoacyl peptidase [Mucilaginibacter pocheonensis]